MFDMRSAIARKRDGERLEAGDWASIVAGHQHGLVDDAQLAALLMACVWRGLDPGETAALTRAMVGSGETLAPPAPNCVDKHSSGGVADTASLIVVPLVAACGIPVAKLSGRALGHTGGTLDKLEAIDGVRTDLSPERFAAQVRDVGCAIAAQSDRLVPADKRIYALRDRTSTVESLGLIASSIVSKKIAAGALAFVFDVKVGRGSFLIKLETARELAEAMVALSASFGRKAVALVTDMNEPLGPAIGSGLEAIEARDFLRGTRAADQRLRAVCERLASAMLAVGNAAGDPHALVERALASGAAYEKFEQMLAAQGATRNALEKLVAHKTVTPLHAERSGYLASVDAIALGLAARALVERSGSSAGIVVEKRIGDRVESGERLATVYGDPAAAPRVLAAFSIEDEAPPERPLVYCETGFAGALSGAGGAAAGSNLETK
jgi:pyrimidine-nucleoside phosphorylase